MSSKKQILYAGDSPPGGVANYLLGILNTLPVKITHIPPDRKISGALLKKRFDAYILSDFPRAGLSPEGERRIADAVEKGAGLLMIGGWASFAGPMGRWQGSLIDQLLPVRCLKKDDRRNICTGLLIRAESRHAVLKGLSFKTSPVICGLNEVRMKQSGKLLLSAVPLMNKAGRVSLRLRGFPLLAVDRNPRRRIAALTTDLAPHWCGGWVDWGARRRVLKVPPRYAVEVGSEYIRFGRSLVSWLAG